MQSFRLRDGAVAWRAFDGEGTLLHLDRQEIHGMNAAATAIQQAYTGPAAGLPTKASVLTWVDRLNEVLQVPGATGPFSLGNHGRLVNFTIPLYMDTHGQRVPFTPVLAAQLGLR